ncbi:MAG: hypothetical protein WDW38_000699 [Sanguina aurantia]
MRKSMQTNPLLVHTELGQVRKCQFSNPGNNHVFGYTATKDPEGAREVTGIWKQHTASPPVVKGQTSTSPVPDFKTMNKLAAIDGLTSAKELPSFRASHMVTVKPFDVTKSQKSPSLPSDRSHKHTYGMASSYRSAEVIRACGPEEPPVKWLVQGAYQDAWVQDNASKDLSSEKRPYIPPVPTRAVLGHSFGAAKHLAAPDTTEPWKMAKFLRAGPRVTAYMGGSTISGAAALRKQSAALAAQPTEIPAAQ